MNKPGISLLVALIVVTELIGLRWELLVQARLRAENQALESQSRLMTARPDDRRSSTNVVSPAVNAAAPTNGPLAELNQLRRMAADQQHEIQDLQAELVTQPVPPVFQSLSGSNRFVNLTKESWTSAGFSTPEAALESMLWATSQGDMNAVRASLTPAELERRNNGAWKGRADTEIADAGVQGLSQVSGIQILNLQMMSTNEAHFTVFISGLPQPDQPLWMDVKRVDGEWKSDASEHRLNGH